MTDASCDPEILGAVARIIRQALRRPGQQVTFQITPKTRARDVPGWDSFAMISIVVAVQEAFGIELETEDLDALRDVGDLVRAIAARRPNALPGAEPVAAAAGLAHRS